MKTNVFIKFSDTNIWEVITNSPNQITAFYRKRVSRDESINNIKHDERTYRLWKTYTHLDKIEHMPDAFPMIFEAQEQGFELINKVSDTKYIFTKMMK